MSISLQGKGAPGTMMSLSCANCRWPCALFEISSQDSHVRSDFIKSVIFLPRQMIFEQGESHEGCYLICDGWILLRARTATGRCLALSVAGPGELIGVGSFLQQSRHEISAQALTQVRARYLTRIVVEQILQEPSVLTSRLLQIMARQVKWLRRQSQILAHRASVRERLAALLLELSQRYGTNLKDRARQIEPRLSVTLLAQMLDNHRGTVSEALSELQRRGLIVRTGGRFVIRDAVKLQELAESVF
jgi:CRP-like cAMP-binding protein